MKAEDIRLTDWRRILLGEVPWSFLVEACLRTVLLYLVLVACMRLMGKRMSSQIGRNEMAALVSLAAAIGLPLEAPDRGLLPAIAVALVIVLVQRGIARRASKDEKFESLAFDDYDILVTDGAMHLEEMERARITKERLFAELRSHGVTHLGLVKRVYMESNGRFTVIRNQTPRPGLSIIPYCDAEFEATLPVTTFAKACGNCGKIQGISSSHIECANCRRIEWAKAYG